MSGPPALYLITDRRACQRPLAEVIDQALTAVGGARVAIQLREKDLGGKALFELGRSLLPVCRSHGAALLINDRIDVALALGADGVHLGEGSIPARDVRRLLGPQKLIGISSHSPAELEERAAGASFAVWGPVFATPSKAQYGPPVGTHELGRARKVGLPIVALGGIDPSNAGGLRAAGFAGVACIRAVISAHDPGRAARALLDSFDAGAAPPLST